VDQLFPIDDLKRCCTCKEVKLRSEFNRARAKKDGPQPSCRECNRQYHYDNWPRHMAQIRKRRRRLREEARAFLIDYLRAHPCVDCGERDIVVLEFDHLRDKRAAISQMIGNQELRTIKAEIEKCDVVCANCHRRRTASRGGWYRHRAG